MQPILKSCCHVILLATSQTLLHKPRDLFCLLQIVRPELFVRFQEFADRYCGPSYQYSHYSGSSYVQELQLVLSQSILIQSKEAESASKLNIVNVAVKVKIQAKARELLSAIENSSEAGEWRRWINEERLDIEENPAL